MVSKSFDVTSSLPFPPFSRLESNSTRRSLHRSPRRFPRFPFSSPSTDFIRSILSYFSNSRNFTRTQRRTNGVGSTETSSRISYPEYRYFYRKNSFDFYSYSERQNRSSLFTLSTSRFHFLVENTISTLRPDETFLDCTRKVGGVFEFGGTRVDGG